MVKVELSVNVTPGSEPTKAPRLIEGCTPEMTILTAPWYSALLGVLKKKWNQESPIFIAIGSDSKTVGDYIASPPDNWLIDEDDVSNWDSCVQKYNLLVCKRVLRHFHAPSHVVEFFTRNFHKRGVTKSGIRYECPLRIGSGEAWTAVFNSIINAVDHIFIFCRRRHLTVAEASNQIKMVVTGDDNTLRYPSPRISWKDEMAQLGFKSTCKPVASLTSTEFCSSRVSPSGGRTRHDVQIRAHAVQRRILTNSPQH
uniref:RNA-dependent RNA polymerase n=1 Tax=uncultured virus TaxID=340016 RepID=H9EJ05_9VIRU|nr:RNA-dependent RNA polymerase [uncultured virus]